jgi:dTDP-4-amino-4,6-dideoxygalactose transaminase
MVNIKEKIEKQRHNSKILLEELKDTNLILPIEERHIYWNYYLFPVIFSKKSERDKSEKYLRKRGIDTSKLYSQTPQKAKSYGYENDCANTEDLVDKILTIPNHHYLPKHEILRIAHILKESLR